MGWCDTSKFIKTYLLVLDLSDLLGESFMCEDLLIQVNGQWHTELVLQ